MKTINFFATLLVVAGIVCSCSKQKGPESAPEAVQYEQLTESLNEYSSAFMTSAGTKSRFWKSLGRIVSCDAAGAIFGGAFLGPGGALFGAIAGSVSRFVAELIESDAASANKIENYYYRDALLYCDELLLSESDSLGILHNQILVSILDERPDIATLSENEINALIANKISEEGACSVSTTVDDYEFYSALSNTIDADNMFDDLAAQYPSISKELQIVKIYADVIANIDEEDIPEYTEGYRKIIDDSDIEETSKKLVKSTISVAGSSKLLWEEEEFGTE